MRLIGGHLPGTSFFSDDKQRRARFLILLGVFLVLAYLYISLSEPPLPEVGTTHEGIRHVYSIYGWGKERLDSPNAVASDKDGNIYIADTANHRVVSFNRDGDLRFVIGKKAKSPDRQLQAGPILFPIDVALADNGDIYIVSMQRSRVFVYNKEGVYKREIMSDRPISALVVKDRLFVANPGQIWVFSLRGDLLNRWGNIGRELGSFRYPNGLAADNEGNIFVSDTQNSRLQILNKDGGLVGWHGRPPRNLNDSQRLFGLNMGIAIDDRQRVYVVDAFRHSIHAFDHDGNKLGEFGKQGDIDGVFNYPSGIAYMGSGLFAVADKWNDRVQVVRIKLPAAQAAPADTARSALPYVALGLLFAVLVALSWRQKRISESERVLEQGLAGVKGFQRQPEH